MIFSFLQSFTKINIDGKIYSWGSNKYGQLGLGDNLGRNLPEEIIIES